MKTLLVSAMLLAVSAFWASEAHAWLPVQVQTFVTPQQVTFQVENVFAAPIVCEGRFMAATASMPMGEWANFAIGPVVAGTMGYAYMTPPYVYQGDYFISVPQTLATCDYYY